MIHNKVKQVNEVKY